MTPRVIPLLLLTSLLIACGQPDPVSAPSPTLPPVTPADQAPAAATAPPEPTPAPATLPPPPTAAPATVAPSPTSPPAPTPTPTPAPITLLTPADFGNTRNRLTGEIAADPALLQRRPIAVKISNSPPEYTRPQAGLSQADLVFEHTTEGPITRFTAIIYGQTPPDMGPVRSARLIDVELPAMYDAALVFSGASSGADGVYNRLAASDFRNRLVRDIAGEPGYYRTDEDKPWEHRLHMVPEQIWQRLDEMGLNEPPTLSAQMAFASLAPDGGQPAMEITVRYRDFTEVVWRYDPETGRYWRQVDGEPHVDANNGQPISAANVVIVYAIHQQVLSICENQVGDRCAAFATETQIWGKGDAIVLRDGRQYPAFWKRDRRSDLLTFWDDQSNPVPLQLGITWFQVVPYHYSNPVDITP